MLEPTLRGIVTRKVHQLTEARLVALVGVQTLLAGFDPRLLHHL